MELETASFFRWSINTWRLTSSVRIGVLAPSWTWDQYTHYTRSILPHLMLTTNTIEISYIYYTNRLLANLPPVLGAWTLYPTIIQHSGLFSVYAHLPLPIHRLCYVSGKDWLWQAGIVLDYPPSLWQCSEALGIGSAGSPGHRLLVPVAADGSSHDLVSSDSPAYARPR